jgi:hypothetical protein
MKAWGLGLALLLAFAGCSGLGLRDEQSGDLERNFQDSDRQIRETKTLAGLAEMAAALDSFVQSERRIPERLDELVPQYLAAIPTADAAAGGHGESSGVKYYPESLLRDGRIDGTKLKDTGKWGYVHNDRQVVVFVDCTHPSSRGKPWYQESGAQ